jgi:gliding motility-associated-like protein
MNSCGSTYDSLVVTVNTFQTTVSADTIICGGADIEVWASGGITYLWQVSGVTVSVDSSFIYSVIVPTRFNVEVTDTNSCVDTASVFASLLEQPVLDLGPDIKTFWGDEYLLNPFTNGIIFLWTPAEGLSCNTCLNPIITDAEIGTFYLSVTNSLGCVSRDSISISYSGSIYVPNSFTPNGDGDNDFFNAFGNGIVSFEMAIYDRWGELLFLSKNMTNSWDGTYLGEPVKTDTYIWKIKYTEILGKSENLSGKLVLLK